MPIFIIQLFLFVKNYKQILNMVIIYVLYGKCLTKTMALVVRVFIRNSSLSTCFFPELESKFSTNCSK